MAKTAIDPERRKEIILSDTPFERITGAYDGERFGLVKYSKVLDKSVATILNPKEARRFAYFIRENLE